MANWTGLARSNYFRVTDRAAFEKHAKLMRLNVVQSDKDKDRVMVVDDDGEGWPNHRCFGGEDVPEGISTNEHGDWEFDVAEEVSRFLPPGEVAIFMEAGSEKARYCSGCAIAVNSAGETRHVTLNDIYDMAKALTTTPEGITRAEY